MSPGAMNIMLKLTGAAMTTTPRNTTVSTKSVRCSLVDAPSRDENGTVAPGKFELQTTQSSEVGH